MIEHIVLFRWTGDASPEAINSAVAALSDMKGKIPAIVDLSCGADFSESGKGYTHGLVVRVKDQAALETYLAHPEHQRVVEKFINPILDEILALDYEF